MTLILSIETSSKICSVSLSKDGQLIDFIELNEANAHASKLAPCIDELMKRNNFEYKQLKAVAFSEGPGSYTGLRIGASLAKGLCFALQIPLIAINSLQSIAQQAISKLPQNFSGTIQPMIDARRMEVYTQSFDRNGAPINQVEALILTSEHFEQQLNTMPIIFCGDGAPKFQSIMQHPNALFMNEIEASSLGMTTLSYQKYQNQAFADIAYFDPFYMKEFAAAVSKIKGLN